MILDDMKINYKKTGAGYYVLEGVGKEIFIDDDAIYFLCGNMIVKKSLSQKTIKRIIRAYTKGRKIWKGDF